MDIAALLAEDHDSPSASSSTSTSPTSQDNKVVAFWRRIAYLTTRTRRVDGEWMGSYEVQEWNSTNTESCENCVASRTKHCVVDKDQLSCRPCRAGKTGCDRKIQFLFSATRRDFYPTMDAFLRVYHTEQPARCRSFQKSANKKLRRSLSKSNE
ncbi:hypothetical protein R3P38DRAFT_2522173 [Favolaschia claudopus]|uniref:Zn(2)-C6 fungal-type domain-containing protein n=1 Tax=Favolaschia claudopus TaxID=2862362 RepID=A0AAW0BY80_9AGAR